MLPLLDWRGQVRIRPGLPQGAVCPVAQGLAPHGVVAPPHGVNARSVGKPAKLLQGQVRMLLLELAVLVGEGDVNGSLEVREVRDELPKDLLPVDLRGRQELALREILVRGPGRPALVPPLLRIAAPVHAVERKLLICEEDALSPVCPRIGPRGLEGRHPLGIARGVRRAAPGAQHVVVVDQAEAVAVHARGALRERQRSECNYRGKGVVQAGPEDDRVLRREPEGAVAQPRVHVGRARPPRYAVRGSARPAAVHGGGRVRGRQRVPLERGGVHVLGVARPVDGQGPILQLAHVLHIGAHAAV
mmetsp:Transcript_4374/g.12790  ORF Transcript_4374/g.12790 Transcript_4374/m.12790 type:complete len:303 (-) Transcript_4374:436-1344(-)